MKFIRQDRAKAVEILVNDLKIFASFNEDLYKEITHLLTLNNFRYMFSTDFLSFKLLMVLFLTNVVVLCRDNAQLSAYADVRTARAIMAQELKKLVEANPSFREKLQFPNLKHSRLRMLINQRLILFSLKFWIWFL